MEKIYMEENQKNSSKKRRAVSSSVVLSFAVAIFAIFSLIVCGISQVSYAIDPETVDTFTFRIGQGSVNGNAEDDIYVTAIGTTDSSKRLNIPLLYSDAEFTKSIYCVERNAPIDDNVIYNKDSNNLIENDPYGFGLLYILNNSYATGNSSFLPNSPEKVRIWATQAAIWLYLDQMYVGQSNYELHKLSDNEKALFEGGAKFYLYDFGSQYEALATSEDVIGAVNTLVATAVTYNASHPSDLRISNQPSSFTKLSDGSAYQAGPITVEATNNLKNYTVELKGIDGAYVVDENGQNITSALNAGQNFYLRVPADKVTTEVQTLKVNVNGSFNMLTGYYYVAEGLQKVVSVTDKTLDVPAEFSLDIVGAPDTGMTTAQTIYFIGLIVLLCGVGIVYANAKPVESK